MTPFAHAFTLALLHFVWQGALAAAFLRIMLWSLRNSPAKSRYLASCVTLAVLTALPAITTYDLLVQPAAPESSLAAASFRIAAFAAAKPISAPLNWAALAEAWTFPLWGIGVVLFSFRMGWGCATVTAFRRRGTPVDGALLSSLAVLRERLGVTRGVRVLVSTAADGPAVVGWIRPVILLPASVLTGLSTEYLEAVLAHELAHIRRHDYLANLWQMAMETLLFYHPAVWWISSRMRHERELCCDDLAAQVAGTLRYARALTAVEKLRTSAPALAIGAADGPLFYRIQRLMGGNQKEYGVTKLTGVLALSLALAGGTMSVIWARVQSPAASEFPQEPPVPVEARVKPEVPRPAANAPAAAPADPHTVELLEQQLHEVDRQIEFLNEKLKDSAIQTSDGNDGTIAKLIQAEQMLAYLQQRGIGPNHPDAIAQERIMEALRSQQAKLQDQMRLNQELREAGLAAQRTNLENMLQAIGELQRRMQEAQQARIASEPGRARALAGRRLAVIDARGVGSDLHLPVYVGEALTEATIDQTFAEVKQLNEKLVVVFSALDDGEAKLRISANGPLR